MSSRLATGTCLVLTILGLIRRDGMAAEVTVRTGPGAEITFDDPKEECMLGPLMARSDLIVIGTVAATRLAPGGKIFSLSDGESVVQVADIHIERLLASAWPQGDIGSHLGKEAEYGYGISVCQLRPSDAYGPRSVLNDPSLLSGGKYLLWLREYRLAQEDATALSIKPGTSYRVTNGPMGAILLSDPATLPGHAVRQRMSYDPLKRQNEILEKRFGKADVNTVLKATEDFATILVLDRAEADNRLRQLARRPEMIYAMTADRLAKMESRKQLFRVDLGAISSGTKQSDTAAATRPD